MDTTAKDWIVFLTEKKCLNLQEVGGKAASLAKMLSSNLCIPAGFCLTVHAYQHFVDQSKLSTVLQMELERKPLERMRWEEIWDAALRIRSAFLKAPIPQKLLQAILNASECLDARKRLAVRSSAPGEDSGLQSFAGLHESIVGVQGRNSLLRAVRTVWASLWSDAALLYRKELNLDPLQSRMAVIVQEMVPAETSGVAFGRDPRNQIKDREIVEAVPGPCSNLVDGLLEPDRWILQHSSGEILEWKAGERNAREDEKPLLLREDLRSLHLFLNKVENLFGWPPDMEWAAVGGDLTVLQARPITSGQAAAKGDERRWYLSLRPKLPQLRRLAERVSKLLIPELQNLGHRLAQEEIENLDDNLLAQCIDKRKSQLDFWRDIYKQDFIPLAHGVRYFGAYYNDVLQPADPYEFITLLAGQNFIASKRNAALLDLAQTVKDHDALRDSLSLGVGQSGKTPTLSWSFVKERIARLEGGPIFLKQFEQFLTNFMDTSYNNKRLSDHPESLFNLLYQLVRTTNESTARKDQSKTSCADELRDQFLKAAGQENESEAREIMAIGQASWRLRDDDNILLGRIESQFLRALDIGVKRLRAADRLNAAEPTEKYVELIIQGLRDPSQQPIFIEPLEPEPSIQNLQANQKPRQLIGQPASPGLAEGLARLISGVEDFSKFERGDILVCESIQPTMTHLVPLASGIVERRGGMLIHGAIIARELGIPCVNGVANAMHVICDGEELTVDGFLGIVTLGTPDFEMEKLAFSR